VHQTQENVLEVLQAGTQRVFRGKVSDRLRQVRSSKQLHRHGCQLCRFGSGVPLPDQWLVVGSEGVKCVSGLMQQGVDIIDEAHRVHEDERPSIEVQGFTVSARRLSLSAFQIQQPLVDHDLELAAELGIHVLEDTARRVD
jgi:hypothetical protein